MAKTRTKVGFTGHVREIDVDVPEGEPAPWGVDAQLKVVGTNVPRVDGPPKVTGRARYTYDINLPGMLVARILHAPWGAATIRKLDVARAKAMPGVRGVHVFKDQGRPVAYHGDEILAIAADSEEEAEDALTAVDVQYEMKPVVTTIAAAMKPGAPAVFSGEANVVAGKKEGDPDKAAAAIKGAARVVEATYETQVQTHGSLEPHGAVAKLEADGSLTLYCSTQATFGVKEGSVRASGLPAEKVRVIAENVGGGFGSKFSLAPSGKAAIELARQTKRPVKLMLTREGEHTTGGNRPSSLQKMRGGVGRDGKVKGLVVETFGSSGVGQGGSGCTNPAIYKHGEGHKVETHVFTNGGPAAAFRAPGHPQGIFALESFMDEMALAAGMDPLAFRKKNIDDPVYLAQWDMGAARIGWSNRQKKAGGGRGPLKRGLGMASSLWYQMGGPGSDVDVVIGRDGSVEARNGAQDIGTGTRTVLACIVAEELGLAPAQVIIRLGDTSLPRGPGSGGSKTAPTLGPAARTAAFQAKQKLLALAAKPLGVDVADLRMEGGLVAGRGKSMTFAEACKLIEGGRLEVRGARAKNYEAFAKTAHGCQFADVEVDTETGITRVVKVVAIQDAGRVISKLTFESQIVGGVIQGLSYALYEDRILDRNLGTQLNADMLGYKIAGPAEMPEIVPVAFDVANAGNNCGMMGLGEPPTIPTAAAIANAIFNATGARVRSLPITPDKLLAALAQQPTRPAARGRGQRP